MAAAAMTVQVLLQDGHKLKVVEAVVLVIIVFVVAVVVVAFCGSDGGGLRVSPETVVPPLVSSNP